MNGPAVKRTWLRFDDVECTRCHRWAGPEGDTTYTVDGHVVCVTCVTHDERKGADPQ